MFFCTMNQCGPDRFIFNYVYYILVDFASFNWNFFIYLIILTMFQKSETILDKY